MEQAQCKLTHPFAAEVAERLPENAPCFSRLYNAVQRMIVCEPHASQLALDLEFVMSTDELREKLLGLGLDDIVLLLGDDRCG